MTEEHKKKIDKMVTDFYLFPNTSLVAYEVKELVYKVVTEVTKELQEENERLKKDSEENQDLATIAYMQGLSKNKAKLDEAKEIISAYIALVNRLHNVKIFNLDEELGKKAENFLKK